MNHINAIPAMQDHKDNSWSVVNKTTAVFVLALSLIFSLGALFLRFITRKEGKPVQAALLSNRQDAEAVDRVAKNRLLGLNVPEDAQGMKVRSFSLELLSNIEDLEKKDSIKREDIKGSVKSFIEEKALEKKANFSDFLRFLDSLKEKSQDHKLDKIFNRFSHLLELQNALSPKQKEKASGWSALSVLVRSGLFRRCIETADAAQKMGLRGMPEMPKRQTIVNLYPTFDAINLVESEHRAAGRWLMANTRVITFRELCQSIEKSFKDLHDSMRKWDDYYLFSVKGKSQEWMANISYPYLPKEKLPKGILTMNSSWVGDQIFDHLKDTASKNFILVDDGAYSGMQFNTYLDQLYGKLLTSDPLKEEKNIYFIFGHFPKSFKTDLSELKKRNVNIHIISNIPTKTCRELIEEQGLSEHDKQQIDDLAYMSNPLVVTEWKMPDGVSTAPFITEGTLRKYQSLSRAAYNQLQMKDVGIKELHGIGPITDVKPPYRKPV